ncbi:hypothetical protein NHQ30_010067 [Ciborinia camelliae]|nr:hypothetical protein NHQ30_010067 [Ciborinia camelliae]
MDEHQSIKHPPPPPHVKLENTTADTAHTPLHGGRNDDIFFELNTQKPELQALYSRYGLETAGSESTADQKLIDQLIPWWSMNVKTKLEELKSMDLNHGGERVDYIKDLILKMCVRRSTSGQTTVEIEKIISGAEVHQEAKVANETNEGSGEDFKKPFNKCEEEYSDMADLGEELEFVTKWGKAMATNCKIAHRGLYLLFMSFYHRLDHRRQLLKLSDNCSTTDVQALQPFLRGLPEFKTLTSNILISYLQQDHPEPVIRLTKWMQSEFGQVFCPTPDFLKVSGFSDDIWQFSVLNPPAQIRESFDAAVSRHGGQTSVRWHGTAINCLHSILQNGFMTDKIWTAGKPSVSWRYAFKLGAREALHAVRHPLFEHGVLLGLEVASSQDDNIVVRLRDEADRYMVRYIFLLPPNMPKPSARSSRMIKLSMEASYREWPSAMED